MNNLQKTGGIAAILEAVIYITAFIIYGAVLEFPENPTTTQKLTFLSDNQLILSVMNLAIYVLFGILLAVIVMALHERLKRQSPAISQIASIFGYIWVCLVIASGMINNTGLASVLSIATEEPERAITVWLTISSITEGLGGGNEVVGGLWVLLLSCASLKSNNLPKPLSYVGVFVGLAGILTIYPEEVLTEIFGLSQIIWFIWLGVSMQRKVSE